MKKFIKNNIIGFILGAIIFGSIGVLASGIIANDIGYTPKDTTWKKSNGEDITNVKDAIDELYTKASNNLDTSYTEIFRKDGIYSNFDYTITENDTKYKKLLILVSATNDTKSNYPARITVQNENIAALYDDNAYQYSDNGLYITNDIYFGVISNILEDDVIHFSGLYGIRIFIYGVD